MEATVKSLIWSQEPKAKSLVSAVVEMSVKEPPLFKSWNIHDRKYTSSERCRLNFGQSQSAAAARGGGGSEKKHWIAFNKVPLKLNGGTLNDFCSDHLTPQ